MLADKAGSAPEPGHDWSQTAEQSPSGVVCLYVARAGAETEPAANKQSHREETCFLNKEAQSVSLSYFLN
ncbi:hypothetical protein GBF38_007813, partial [Nibea albiflora]